MARHKIISALAVFAVLYLGIGLAFHLKWNSALKACQEMHKAQGEFVEPEVLGGVIGLAFDVTNWPVYAWANLYHDGLLFATPCTHPNNSEEKAAVSRVVTDFGKHLQNVSLLGPNVAQAFEKEYAEFVSPELLKSWAGEPAKAPGRLVSSPWPDHIEITSVVMETPTKYLVSGYIVELTSNEVRHGGAAAKIPVQIVVEKRQGRWLITGYAEKR